MLHTTSTGNREGNLNSFGQVDRNEEASRIKIILTGFIDHPYLTMFSGAGVRDYLIAEYG
jgi:hypothetical protein